MGVMSCMYAKPAAMPPGIHGLTSSPQSYGILSMTPLLAR
jgi:hypothetical protein